MLYCVIHMKHMSKLCAVHMQDTKLCRVKHWLPYFSLRFTYQDGNMLFSVPHISLNVS
jgi:hypothetical protein